jgi:hypothetical protein
MKAVGEIPVEMRQFIVDNIDSVAQLEALLLLRGATGQAWSCDAVAKRLYIPPKTAADLLRVLHERELIMLADPDARTYRYGPTTADRVRLVEQLAITYAQRLVAVTLLIHAKAARSIEGFADAFRLRDDDT